jgi:glucose/mannose transport system substrate-binding protein
MAMSRRRFFLAAAGVVGAAAGTGLLSACSSDSASSVGTNGKPGHLEVFSWWTDPGEKAALDALVSVFNLANPNIKFINRAVAGGGGAPAQQELARRLAAKNPPDTFQAQAGEMVGDYITAGQIEDVTFLYKQQGWDKQFSPKVLDLIQRDGKFYSVPVDTHHINVLWANPNVCKAHGIDPRPTSIAQFIDNLRKLKKAGQVIPLAVSLDPGQEWQVKHIMETVLVSTLGAEAWAALWKRGANWNTPKITEALNSFAEIMTFAPGTGTNVTGWDQVCALVGGGEAAYQIMGDWVEANFTVAQKLNPGTDYTWCAVPGTMGTFLFASDCFTLPVGAKDRAATIAWLTTCGSLSGQDSFTTVKGAIPPRAKVTAAERTLFSPYLQWSLDEWHKDTIVGSLTHGVVASGAWNAAVDVVVSAWIKDRDTPKLQQGLIDTAAKYSALAHS